MSGNFLTDSCCLETDRSEAFHNFCNFTLYLKTIQILTMQINFYRITGILFLFLLLVVNTTGFAGNQNVSAIRAMQLFDAGNYAEAEKMFGILLEEEPRNPMLNYYYG